MHESDSFAVDTILSHYGEDDKILGAVVPPIFQTSLFTFDTTADFAAGFQHDQIGEPYVYSRMSNPTVDLVEQKVAKLEGTEAAKAFGSGQGALTAATLSAVEAGSHVVIVDTCYGPQKQLVRDYLAKFGVTHTMVDGCNSDEVIDAIRPETSLICLESPSSILMKLQDVEVITREARSRGITTMIDNTYSTPLYHQPAKWGVDLIVHSATKYLAGHSDLTAGVVCGSRERMTKMIQNEVGLFGSILAPFPAWLMNRGMRTLRLRLEQVEKTANHLAGWLNEHPSIERVNHISLPNFRQRDLFLKYFKGSSGLFSFEPKNQDSAKILAFVDALRVYSRGVSWGGHESLAVALSQTTIAEGERWYIRLYCGLEDVRDLQRDLENAFAVSGL